MKMIRNILPVGPDKKYAVYVFNAYHVLTKIICTGVNTFLWHVFFL